MVLVVLSFLGICLNLTSHINVMKKKKNHTYNMVIISRTGRYHHLVKDGSSLSWNEKKYEAN
jgi:hypothetical protein